MGFKIFPSSKGAAKDSQRKAPTVKATDKHSKTAPSLTLDDDNLSLSSQTEIVRPTLPKKTDLACYKCDKRFGVDRHSDLIDHLDVCTGPK